MSSTPGLLHVFFARRARGVVILSILLMLALTACAKGYNYVPAGSPTAPKKPTATATPKPGTAFTYAFARDGQIWIVQPGKEPQQISQLPSGSLSISSLAWSPDGKHLAFERTGSGNPVDYAMDTATGAVTALNVPSTTTKATFGWSDNNTVITAKQTSDGNTQVWKENITTQDSSKISQFTGTSQVEVRSQSFYYAIVDSSTNQLMLHRYDINIGSEGTPAALMPAGSSTINVNWDVSPDGSHVAMGFNLATADSSWANGFWYISTSDSTDRDQIFTELSMDSFKASDPITLSIAPDNQTVVLDTQSGTSLSSESFDGTGYHQYTPQVGISSNAGITWAPNGVNFALSSADTPGQVTIYTLGSSTSGTALTTNATLAQWSPKS
jgi:dipeptidyl aminopeptidase/acylaminoacyl peptidase